MEITEVHIKLMEDPSERLQAFCSITFDYCFVIRDLKIIEGTNGPFVAMPSRKLTAHCPKCGCKNHLRAAYCNQCGLPQPTDRIIKDEDGRAKLYADIAHPINSACREMIQVKVIAEFILEHERAKQPGYVSRYDEYDYEDFSPAKSPHARPNPPHYNKPHESRSGQSGGGHGGSSYAPRTPHMKSHAEAHVNNAQPAPPAMPAPAPEATVESPQPKEASPGDFGAGIF